MDQCNSFVPVSKEQWIGMISYFVINEALEFYLGKTQRTQASSKVELVLLFVKSVLEKMRGKNGSK